MTATTTFRSTKFSGEIPHKGTFPMAANELIHAGTIVCVNASGEAVAGVDVEGFAAVGKAGATYDNRTSTPLGGGAGAINAEVQFGVFGWRYTGDAPSPGQVVYVVDNQTVSADSDSGQRGIAGYCSETRDSLCHVWMGPHVAGQIVIAAAEASQLDTAQADIDDLQADVSAGEILIPLNAFRLLATGAALGQFSAGVSDGLEVADSEALCYRWNDDSTAAIVTQVSLPSDLDGAADVVVHLMGARVGSADATAAIDVGAFFLVPGAAHTADSDAGGDSSAFDGATTVLTEETRTIAAADVPDGPAVLTLTLVPTAALDDDDLRLFGVRITFGKTIASA